jgi:photosystem I subunit 3
MRVKFSSLLSSFVTFFIFTFCFFSTTPTKVQADFKNLTLCKESPAFEKRLNTQLKKLENRSKIYIAHTLESDSLLREIKNTKARFKRYANSNLLCGKEGLPRIIANGEWNHANEFVIPGLLFLYITGWIGWVGRKYIIFASKSENSFENEIILNVPVAYGIANSGFLWPIEAWIEFKNGDLIAKENEITISPR